MPSYAIPQGGALAFNTIYYTRVMIWTSGGSASIWHDMDLCNGYPSGTTGGCQTSGGGVPPLGFGDRWITPLHAWPDTDPSAGHGFIFSPSSPAVGTPVIFTDRVLFDPTTLLGQKFWSWDFSGGSPGTSALQSPTNTYSVEGSYSVTELARDGAVMALGVWCPYPASISARTVTVGKPVPIWKEVIPK